MKATPNRFFLSLARRAELRRWAARHPRICRLPGIAPRHASWAQQILVKLTRRRALGGLFPEAMIPLFPARSTIHLLQNFTANNWIAAQSAPSLVPARDGVKVCDRVLQFYSRHETRPVVQNFFKGPFRREAAGELGMAHSAAVPAPHPVGLGVVLPNRLQTALPEGLDRFRLRSERRDVRSEAGAPLLQLKRRFLVANSRVAAEESPFGARDLLENVVSKHRRVETPVPIRAQVAVLGSSQNSEGAAAGNRGVAALGRPRFGESEAEPRNAPRRPEFPFDASRVTDEVLKQLDRRIVAAKERRGRI